MEIKTLNKIIATIQSVDSYYCMKEFMDVRILYRDDAIRTELIDIKLSNDSIDTKNTRIKSLICSHRFFKSRAQIPDNLFIYSLFPVPLFLTSCLKEFFVFSRLNENTNIPEGIEVLNTIEDYEKIKDESLSLDIPSYNSFVDEFWLNCSNINDIGKVVVFYKNKLKDVILNFNLEAKAIKLMDENLSEFLEMGLMTDSIFKALSETYKIKIDEQFAYFDKINYFLEDAEYSMNPEDNPNYMGMRENIENATSLNTKTEEEKNNSITVKYECSQVLMNYSFWVNLECNSRTGYKNIFKGIDETDFISMINQADFSRINPSGIGQRIKYNIFVLSRLLGRDWGETAATKLDTNLRECGKMSSFAEFDDIKNMYLP